MRKFSQFLFLVAMIGTLPIGAHAQWATSRVERDWRVTINGSPYGLTQEFFSTFSTIVGTRTTTLYLGPHTYRTRLPAVCVATLAVVPLVGAVALLLFAMLPEGYRTSRRSFDKLRVGSATKDDTFPRRSMAKG